MHHCPAIGAPVRVALAHQDPIVRAGLAALLAPAGFDIDGADEDGAAPQLVVTDHADGLARACADSRQQGPRILIVTQLEREWDVRRALAAGVHGYLLQNCAAEQLLAAAAAVGRGQRFLSLELARYVADSFSHSGLTGRETDVLQLLAQGCCNKTIARELGIGVGTVKGHVKGLFDKLGATARTHAVVLATRRGLIAGDNQLRA